MSNQLAHVTGEELGMGDHVAFFFKSNSERFAFVIPFMLSGLQNRERCVYIAHENSTADIWGQAAVL